MKLIFLITLFILGTMFVEDVLPFEESILQGVLQQQLNQVLQLQDLIDQSINQAVLLPQEQDGFHVLAQILQNSIQEVSNHVTDMHNLLELDQEEMFLLLEPFIDDVLNQLIDALDEILR